MQRPGFRDRFQALPGSLRVLGGVAGLLLLAGAFAAGALLLTGALGNEKVQPADVYATAVEGDSDADEDPFAWSSDRRQALEKGAAAGYSHVLYALSPGGIEASAKRTLRFEDEIAAAADAHGVSAEIMEAMVLLESAGRPDAIAGATDPANASGLAQIVASTGSDLLGMDIDLDRSRQLTTAIAANEARVEKLREKARKLAKNGEGAKPKKGRGRGTPTLSELMVDIKKAETAVDIAARERAEIDPRFDPEAALDGMARYLEIATDRFGREDLAVTSYHMGIGNLGDVIAAYVGPEQAQLAVKDLVTQSQLSYTQLFFDSSPINHAAAWKVLSGLSDDSSTYYWRVLAAREILRLWRDDPGELERLAELQTNKATAEEVFHPQADTRTFDTADELQDGLDSGELEPIPPPARTEEFGFVVGPQLGELTDQLGVERSLYRALRPEALATLIYMSGRVRAITGKDKQTLTVTSAVRDQAYQDALVGSNAEATRAYSLHTSGYSFDILRNYASDKQARAFQFVLDRMKALGVIDYAVEPSAIHVTVSDRAEPLLG